MNVSSALMRSAFATKTSLLLPRYKIQVCKKTRNGSLKWYANCKEGNKSCKGSDNDITKARATNSKPERSKQVYYVKSPKVQKLDSCDTRFSL